MAKKSTKYKISKKHQKSNRAAGLKELWVDGSFFDQDGLAGGGAVLCDFDGKILSTLSFELNHLGITDSLQSELWTAVSALQKIQPESIGRIVCDNQIAVSAMEKIRTGKALKAGMDESLKAMLSRTVLSQPHMEISRNMTRGQGKIPLADGFAKAAARADQASIEKQIRRGGHHPHQHFPSV